MKTNGAGIEETVGLISVCSNFAVAILAVEIHLKDVVGPMRTVITQLRALESIKKRCMFLQMSIKAGSAKNECRTEANSFAPFTMVNGVTGLQCRYRRFRGIGGKCNAYF